MKLRKSLTAIQYESIYSFIPALIATLLFKIKVLGDDIGFYIKKAFVHRIMEALILKYTHYIIVTNPELYSHISNLGKKAILVQNGLTPEKFDLYKKIFKRIVFVGALTYKENINAIKVIAQLSKMLIKSNVDYEILIIGGPRVIVKKILSENRNIKFLGFLEENYYKEVLKSAYIGLLPFFHKEELGGQRIKALEYLSHGILTVSSFEGVRGIQGLKANEHYINVSCIDELCDKIKEILKEPMKYLNIAKKGREFVINNYAWSKTTIPYVELIKSLCEEL